MILHLANHGARSQRPELTLVDSVNVIGFDRHMQQCHEHESLNACLAMGLALRVMELGRGPRPFRACEIARVEDVVEALAERIVVAGWLD